MRAVDDEAVVGERGLCAQLAPKELGRVCLREPEEIPLDRVRPTGGGAVERTRDVLYIRQDRLDPIPTALNLGHQYRHLVPLFSLSTTVPSPSRRHRDGYSPSPYWMDHA